MAIELWIAVVFGALLGSALVYLALRLRSAAVEARLALIAKDLLAARSEFSWLQEANSRLREQAAYRESTLQHERQSAAEKLDLINRSFFFNDTATTEIYTLSLHDALPRCRPGL